MLFFIWSYLVVCNQDYLVTFYAFDISSYFLQFVATTIMFNALKVKSNVMVMILQNVNDLKDEISIFNNFGSKDTGYTPSCSLFF